jgi:hypothetical protein
MRLRKQILCVVLVSLFGLTGLGTAQVDDAPSLAGVIDIHAHVAPESAIFNFKRAFDAIEAAQIARIYGMRGIVLKVHYTETASWAYLVSQMVPGVEVFGGVVLNKAVGGINPVAVEAMAGVPGGRGRIVYMPTMDAAARHPARASNAARSPVIGFSCHPATNPMGQPGCWAALPENRQPGRQAINRGF